jgi:hypothetical protein
MGFRGVRTCGFAGREGVEAPDQRSLRLRESLATRAFPLCCGQSSRGRWNSSAHLSRHSSSRPVSLLPTPVSCLSGLKLSASSGAGAHSVKQCSSIPLSFQEGTIHLYRSHKLAKLEHPNTSGGVVRARRVIHAKLVERLRELRSSRPASGAPCSGAGGRGSGTAATEGMRSRGVRTWRQGINASRLTGGERSVHGGLRLRRAGERNRMGCDWSESGASLRLAELRAQVTHGADLDVLRCAGGAH